MAERPTRGWGFPAHDEPIHFAVMDGAAERRAAWKRGEAEYVAVLRRQFPPVSKPEPARALRAPATDLDPLGVAAYLSLLACDEP